MRIPEPGPFGETSFDASSRAIVAALLLNRPSRGCVESVFTSFTHFLPACRFVAAPVIPDMRKIDATLIRHVALRIGDAPGAIIRTIKGSFPRHHRQACLPLPNPCVKLNAG